MSVTEWKQEMLKWRGRSWVAPDAHWCADWDELPVDACTAEYVCCVCFPKTVRGRVCNWLWENFLFYPPWRRVDEWRTYIFTNFKSRYDDGPWWKLRIVLCRWRGHPYSVVYYNPNGYEPDMTCTNCGEDLG